jgi:hypothetical protein
MVNIFSLKLFQLPILILGLIGFFTSISIQGQSNLISARPSGKIPLEYIIYVDNPEVVPKVVSEPACKQYGLEIVRKISKYMEVYFLRSETSLNHEVEQLVSYYNGVISFQSNHRAELRDTEPNDPQWTLQEDHNLLNMAKVWDINTGGVTRDGQEIVIAIIDSGFDTTHVDLVNNIWKNGWEIPGDNVDNDSNGFVDDYWGLNVKKKSDQHSPTVHGTKVLGILGAEGNNSLGITGMNWNVKLMLISNAMELAESITANEYILDMRRRYNETDGAEGAFVVAISYSQGFLHEFGEDHPAFCELYNMLGEEGILTVAAVPNLNEDIGVHGDLPSTCTSDYILSVTNTDVDDQLIDAGFSTEFVDLSAPGDGSLSTTVGSNYSLFSGTSSATPHVAGTIALMYAAACDKMLTQINASPGSAALLIKDLILSGVKSLPELQDRVGAGGRLDPVNSMNLLVDYCDLNPSEKLEVDMLFPNPARETIHAKFLTPDYMHIDIKIYDAKGSLVHEFQEPENILGNIVSEIDLRNFHGGMYFLKATQGENSVLEKFVVQ